jgi:hypothetical protein
MMAALPLFEDNPLVGAQDGGSSLLPDDFYAREVVMDVLQQLEDKDVPLDQQHAVGARLMEFIHSQIGVSSRWSTLHHFVLQCVHHTRWSDRAQALYGLDRLIQSFAYVGADHAIDLVVRAAFWEWGAVTHTLGWLLDDTLSAANPSLPPTLLGAVTRYIRSLSLELPSCVRGTTPALIKRDFDRDGHNDFDDRVPLFSRLERLHCLLQLRGSPLVHPASIAYHGTWRLFTEHVVPVVRGEYCETVCPMAALGGQIAILRRASSLRSWYPWDERTCVYAAWGGHLQVLRWVHAQRHCGWDARTCAAAAQQGQLEILRWAREQRCPWNVWTPAYAAYGGHLEVLQWAIEHGAPWDGWVYVLAKKGAGGERIAQWARAHGCPDHFMGSQRQIAESWEYINTLE